jgi:hypothetical protein
LAVEQAANPPDPFTGIQGSLLMCRMTSAASRPWVRTFEHALTRLRKRRDRADRLIQLVRDSARHLLQRGHACDLEQLFEQYPGILHLLAVSL